jgi:hypothetical protein
MQSKITQIKKSQWKASQQMWLSRRQIFRAERQTWWIRMFRRNEEKNKKLGLGTVTQTCNLGGREWKGHGLMPA